MIRRRSRYRRSGAAHFHRTRPTLRDLDFEMVQVAARASFEWVHFDPDPLLFENIATTFFFLPQTSPLSHSQDVNISGARDTINPREEEHIATAFNWEFPRRAR